ncbi:protein DOWNSTREAM OF FLC-like [Impatiens glandulifera]|uniref:protein DOWNSTREAM OF FLC-like n=1 Tax=Impatiens glandulifera TaxID=253017 RepID=UPI001FB0F187|nr:protein DOWNSTREAM OF FLC-like [Impatiens glandulifera]
MTITTLIIMVIFFLIWPLNFFVVLARPLEEPLTVEGRVYCDICRAGFETPFTTRYIAGARVRIECRDRTSQEIVYSIGGTTDSTGTYKIDIDEDHEDQICEVTLVSSPRRDCAEADPGRDRTRVILTRHNGMASTRRFANAMGFLRYESLAGCRRVMSQYLELQD